MTMDVTMHIFCSKESFFFIAVGHIRLFMHSLFKHMRKLSKRKTSIQSKAKETRRIQVKRCAIVTSFEISIL